MKAMFQCDFCGDVDASSDIMITHELNCQANPRNKNCGSCAFIVHEVWPDSVESTCSKGREYFVQDNGCPDWGAK